MSSQRMVDTKENHNIVGEPKSTLFRDGVAQRQPEQRISSWHFWYVAISYNRPNLYLLEEQQELLPFTVGCEERYVRE
jgi:hypothetical protein